jgi:hypothetical protein
VVYAVERRPFIDDRDGELEQEILHLKESLNSHEEYAEQLRERDSLSFQIRQASKRAWHAYCGYCWFVLLAVIGALVWWEEIQIHHAEAQILLELQNMRSMSVSNRRR